MKLGLWQKVCNDNASLIGGPWSLLVATAAPTSVDPSTTEIYRALKNNDTAAAGLAKVVQYDNASGIIGSTDINLMPGEVLPGSFLCILSGSSATILGAK